MRCQRTPRSVMRIRDIEAVAGAKTLPAFSRLLRVMPLAERREDIDITGVIHGIELAGNNADDGCAVARSGRVLRQLATASDDSARRSANGG